MRLIAASLGCVKSPRKSLLLKIIPTADGGLLRASAGGKLYLPGSCRRLWFSGPVAMPRPWATTLMQVISYGQRHLFNGNVRLRLETAGIAIPKQAVAQEHCLGVFVIQLGAYP